MWVLKKLRQLITSHFGDNVNVMSLIQTPTAEQPEAAEAQSKHAASVSWLLWEADQNYPFFYY